MKLFPESAAVQLELDKIRSLVHQYCKTEYGKTRADELRIHTHRRFIEPELKQTDEYRLILARGLYFPNDFTQNIRKDLKLLSIPGAVLVGDQFMHIRKLADSMEQIFRWFDTERRQEYWALAKLLEGTHYEKAIIKLIDEILDEHGQVKDNASPELADIRLNLYRKRNDLRRVFERIISKLNKQGYLADIEEAFLNGRRVVAVFAEQKRMLKGILHGESDTRRTAFIEPEETISLNNEIFSLENEESREVNRILRQLTQRVAVFADLLKTYHDLIGEYDYIRAKARLALDMNAVFPQLSDKSLIDIERAYHPLLFIYNKKSGKDTIPVTLKLDEKERILVISGPNAGGKTVAMKTVGLLQIMLQSGLLVPVRETSTFGIFRQLMIHIGDTQSLEFELSTYSSHLRHMKHFIETANGRTLFFIDELGSGSDPNLGGAFAEVIMEELARKHAMGIVTTHYLNLKVMANKVPGIINGAMAFDEENLLPLYRLIIGKPGSSYTFSIAQRIGLHPALINRARKMVDEEHFRLDKLLNRTEQDLRQVEEKEKQLNQLLKENERLKKQMEQVLDKEKHRQQVELLKQQNRITEDRIAYLKDMERKLRHIVLDWKKAEDKNEVLKQLHALLFKQQDNHKSEKVRKRLDARYEDLVEQPIAVGVKARMKKGHQVGIVKEIRGKKAVLQVGVLPITVDVESLIAVRDRPQEEINT